MGAGRMAPLKVGQRDDRFRVVSGEIVRVRDLQLGLFVVLTERVLVEQLMVLVDGQCQGAARESARSRC